MIRKVVVVACFASVLFGGTVSAEEEVLNQSSQLVPGESGDRINERLDRRGERINERLDRRRESRIGLTAGGIEFRTDLTAAGTALSTGKSAP